MENIDALQAIERGEKLDQETLLKLNQAHLIDVAQVSNMQSPGREVIYVGMTEEGQRLLKKSKGPLVSDIEKEIILAVVREFLDRHRATPSRDLLRKFKSPIASILQRLNGPVLQLTNNTYPNETYSPRAVAFYHCGDSAALAFARKSTILVLSVLRNLFDKELEGEDNEQRQFTAEEVETAARATGFPVEPGTVFTGLYLAQEFSVFQMIRRDEQQVGIVAFTLTERIYETSWDEHIRRSNISVPRTWERQGESSEEIALPPLSAAGLERYDMPLDNRKIFLVHGHDDETKNTVSKFLRSFGPEVIILHENANQGQTIIEKFEKHSDVVFAVVLSTPDDVGASASQPEKTRRRPRQNVILELGYFMGKLGRGRVCCLYVAGVELPSDYHGVLYVPYDESGNWKKALVKELAAAGVRLEVVRTEGASGAFHLEEPVSNVDSALAKLDTHGTSSYSHKNSDGSTTIVMKAWGSLGQPSPDKITELSKKALRLGQDLTSFLEEKGSKPKIDYGKYETLEQRVEAAFDKNGPYVEAIHYGYLRRFKDRVVDLMLELKEYGIETPELQPWEIDPPQAVRAETVKKVADSLMVLAGKLEKGEAVKKPNTV